MTVARNVRARFGPLVCLGPAVLLAIAATWAAVATGCHVAVSDFWGSTILAAHVQPSLPSTWFSGFFPFAYHVLLSVVPADQQLRTAYAANVAAGVVTTGLVGWTAARWLPQGLAMLAGLALAAWPMFFLYTTTPGPDLIAVALGTMSVAMLLSEVDQREVSGRRLTGAALLLGSTFLIRYHFAFIALGACVGWAVARGVRHRSTVVLAAATGGTASLQMLVSLGAGQGPLSTAQGFNVQRMMYGIDWSSLSSATPIPSVSAVITADPWRFAAAYGQSIGALLPFALPAVLAVLVSTRQRSIARAATLLAAVQLTYIVAVAAGASSRAALPLLPLAVLSATLAVGGLAGLTAAAGRGARRLLAVGLALFLVVLTGRSAAADLSATVRRARAQRSLVAIEEVLRRAGVESPSAVFTTDLSFYLPGMPPHVPWAAGGWYRLDVPDYDRRHPALCRSTPECLVRDAASHHVRAVVIPPGGRTPAGLLWADQPAPVGARRVAAPVGWTVFEVDGSRR